MNCYVLVGGRSTRLGASKPGLFLDRIVDAARPVFDEVIAVDRQCGTDILVCPTILENAHEDEALIFGVRRAIEHANAKCFILAVDYPLITSDLLREWSQRFATSSANMLVPRSGGHLHVLSAGYSSALLPLIDTRIARRQYDLRSIAGDAEIVDYDGAALLNVNTPEELEWYERQKLLAPR